GGRRPSGPEARMTSREKVLGRVKSALGPVTAERKAAVEARLKERPRHLIPERAKHEAGKLKSQFKAFLEGQSATVLEVKSDADVPGAIAGFLRTANLPQRVKHGADPYLAGLAWSKEPQLERLSGPANAKDEVSLSRVVTGVAETGTLVLASGAENPVTLTYLPETHIAVLSAKDIVGPYEDAWQRVRAKFGEGVMPRTVNFVSGPSRTGDIGGQLVMGAHGPRRMCVIIVDA
ncbi:MAG TPA: LUD domain-containing protein, partial [Hyphomicrobiaceae bacterium]|nr:LUD domain-containing protein [Hyphomicrobiaceae bacterium]